MKIFHSLRLLRGEKSLAHNIRIVAGKAGGLNDTMIDQPIKYFDGSTIASGAPLGADYMVLQSDGDKWYLIGGN